MTVEHQSRTVVIPGKLYQLIERRATVTGFGSVEEYIMFILQEVVTEGSEDAGAAFNEQDEEEVKKRLKALGYM